MKAMIQKGLSAICLFMLICLVSLPAFAVIRYVKPVSSGLGDGTSWANASSDLQLMINNSAASDEIWVTAGDYSPIRRADVLGTITIGDRDNAFVLKANVKIYGGFTGLETLLNQRNTVTNITTLNGDIGAIGNATDNCHHVVISAGIVGTAELNGFTIRNGNGNGAANITVNAIAIARNIGGGMINSSSSPTIKNCIYTANSATAGGGSYHISSSPTISNCSFIGNTNNGMYNLTSSPIISDCSFTSNTTASGSGGGMLNFSSSSPVITNCKFVGNSCGFNGGGVYNVSLSNPTYTNCVFSGNSATTGGGVCNLTNTTVTFTNCTIASNKASTGGGMNNGGSSNSIINNCIIYGNSAPTGAVINNSASTPVVSYSMIEGGYAGTGNLNLNPLFVNPQLASAAPTILGDYSLKICSPAINVGLNSLIPVGLTTDLVNNPRINSVTVDMGCYERQLVTALPGAGNILYVDQTKNGNGSSWANALPELADALKAAKTNSAIQQIWVVKGTYYPMYEPSLLNCSPVDNREKAFLLVNNLKLYGGFSGGEVSIAGRDFIANETILSGDLGIPNSNVDNSYHVVVGAGAVGTAELNGFTVKNGNANQTATITVNTRPIKANCGAGIHLVASSPAISNCFITSNTATSNGAGMYDSLASAPALSNCTFTANTASKDAGALYNHTSSPSITNCIFSGNSTTNVFGNSGGAMVNYTSSPFISNCTFSGNSSYSGGSMENKFTSTPTITGCSFTGNTASYGGAMENIISSASVITNCIFSGNTAVFLGGGINNNGSAAAITNCLFSGNLAGDGGAVDNQSASNATYINCTFAANRATAGSGAIANQSSSNAIFRNSIIWGNTGTTSNTISNSGSIPVVSNSLIEGGYVGGTAIITTNPLFINQQLASAAPTTAGNYRLQNCSPAINAGSNFLIPSGITTDLDGFTRTSNNTVDMGAYEKQYGTPNASGIVFVDKTKVGDGSSWANAVTELADALKAAKADNTITQIWVASGTYYPLYDGASLACAPTNNKDKTFLLVNNVKIYGGFAGGETLLSQRDWTTNVAILSGDIGVAGDSTDNCYHVMVSAGAVGTAEVNGFTITKGNASINSAVTINSVSVTRSGGGAIINITSSPQISNCKVLNNAALYYGGAVYNSAASPNINNCIFSENNVYTGTGGGMYNKLASAPTITDCIFSGNIAAGSAAAISIDGASPVINRCYFTGNNGANNGGAITSYTAASNTTISNSVFSGNKASFGGAIHNTTSGSVINLINCTIAGNSGVNGGGLSVGFSAVFNVRNCIIYGNTATTSPAIYVTGATANVSYSLVEGGFTGTGNINVKPVFINPVSALLAPTTSGDYRLLDCSAAVDAGDSTLLPFGTTVDLDSNTRVKYSNVDMGAYEIQFSSALSATHTGGVLFVDKTKSGNGSSWASAITELADALKAAKSNTAITQIWVAKGTYYPLYDAPTLTCSQSNARDASFVLVNNVKVYGGFAGGETLLSQRDWLINPTILSGDIGVTSDSTDNCYHIFISAGTIGAAAMDGFTVTRANANGSLSIKVNNKDIYRSVGGGMFNKTSSPTITNCIFTGNNAHTAAGMYNDSTSSPTISNSVFLYNTASSAVGGMYNINSSTPNITNCIFKYNTSGSGGGGGGMFNNKCSPIITGCTFSANTTTFYGGGMYNYDASPVITGCTFSENTASTLGGGMYNSTSNPIISGCYFKGNTATINGGAVFNNVSDAKFTNCAFSGNAATSGGGIYNSGAPVSTYTNCTVVGNKASSIGGGFFNTAGSDIIIKNCIIYNNTAVSENNIFNSTSIPIVIYTNIEGGNAGAGNINLNPQFVSPQPASAAPTILGDYRLQACSPELNAGDSTLLPPGVTFDLDNNNRVMYTNVDMGAYEKQHIDFANSTWRGANTNWNDKVNWCGGFIPYDTTNVVIPSSLSNYPVINTGYNNGVKNILLSSGSSLALQNNGSLSIYGTYTNNGSAINNNGKLELGGDSTGQYFPGTLATVSAMKDLEINNPSGITFNKSFSITGSLIPTSGNIDVNNVEVTLKSSDTATASVAVIQPSASINYTGSGSFIVERFINTGLAIGQHVKTWQFLATPTTGQTIYQSWQEGGTTPAGYGTWINGTGAGFDVTTTLPSIKYYNQAAVNWTPVTNTGNALVNKLGYMLFVRGDRTVTASNGNPNNTNLRSKGQLFSPTNPAPSVAVSANKYQTFGNPYASRIAFSSVYAASTGINDVFYVWNPKLAGSYNVGGYQTISGIAGYIPTVGTPPTGNPASDYYPAGVPSPNIESGQAVFVKGNGSGGNVNFNENVKVTGSRLVNRPVNINELVARRQFLFTTLFTNTGKIADGNIVAFEKGFGNEINEQDAEKILNGGENFGLMRDGSILAVEAHEPVKATDTIFYNMNNLRRQPYQLRFAPVNMGSINNQPLLIDRFTNINTPLSLTDSSFVDFNVSADPASAAANRFFIVFKMKGKLKFEQTDLKVNKQDNNTSTAKDLEPDNKNQAINIYPNPVIDGNINLWFNNMPHGMYKVRIFNSNGQLLLSRQIQYTGGKEALMVKGEKTMPAGNYQVDISGKDNNHFSSMITFK